MTDAEYDALVKAGRCDCGQLLKGHPPVQVRPMGERSRRPSRYAPSTPVQSAWNRPRNLPAALTARS